MNRKKHDPENYLCHTLPCRQRLAQDYLQGECPGVQQRYAPNATVSEAEGWVEDEETVKNLMKWREEAIY